VDAVGYFVVGSRYGSTEEFLVLLLKQIDKNRNGFIEFEEMAQGLKE